MYFKVKGKVIATNASRIEAGAHDVLLKIQEVDGPPKAKTLIGSEIVFEGVRAEKPFFAGYEIVLRYREELGPRRFDAEVLTEDKSFVELSSLFERPTYVI